MKQTTNMGLALYEKTDKMNVTGTTNSLNHNMEIIDTAINGIKTNYESWTFVYEDGTTEVKKVMLSGE